MIKKNVVIKIFKQKCENMTIKNYVADTLLRALSVIRVPRKKESS